MSGFDGTIPSPLSHSYLITGGNAAARRDYARRLAAAYVCAGERPPCGVCLHCRKAEEDIHPDVITVGPAGDKGEILVDQIRFLRRDAYILPNEARRKVYIIDPADGMNPAAQNALLKVLEEGPDYGAFLLLAQWPDGLLETVRSRCESLSLPPLEEERDPRWEELGRKLAEALLEGGELGRMEAAVPLEKLERPALLEVLARTEEALSPMLSRDAPRVIPLLEAVGQARRAARFNVGSGHLLGSLVTAGLE